MNFGTYFERHLQTLVGSLGRLATQPFASVMIMGVIAIALGLPLCIGVLLQNANRASGNWGEAIDLSVYLDLSATEERARTIAGGLRVRTDIASVKLITAADALAEFREHSGFGDALNSLNTNPLPNVLIVTPSLEASTADNAQALKKYLAGIPDVGGVQLDTDWVQRFHAILGLLRRIGALTAVILLIGVVLVVGNTIRLDILNRHTEIEVMKLVGATDGFARRPFLYSGMLYGLGGGLLSLGLVALVRISLAAPVSRLASFYGSHFALSGLNAVDAVQVIVLAAALGWLGSWIVATRHIRAIEPQ